jgi:hypothetical protein
MKMRKLVFILTTIIVLGLFITTAYATEPEDTTEITADTSTVVEPTLEDLVAAFAPYDCNVVYTPDSVRNKGVWLEPWADTLRGTVGFTISTDLDFGTEIYDDPETDYIDGIRINGEVVTSKVYTIPLDNPQDYIVDVKIVYMESLAGDIARISDGTYDWAKLLENPIVIMQIIYYAIAAISIIVGGIGALCAKKKKVKSADDIASAVQVQVSAGIDAFAIQFADMLKDQLLPIIQNSVDTNKSVVKAVALSTSKSKEAPVALLDTLKEISDVDTERMIEEARQAVLNHIANTDAQRANVRSTLEHIANGTYQEVHNVEKSTEAGLAQAPSKEDEAKSVF